MTACGIDSRLDGASSLWSGRSAAQRYRVSSSSASVARPPRFFSPGLSSSSTVPIAANPAATAASFAAFFGLSGAADRRRRIIAIVGASSGNLVEWYDFYAYAFTSIYFASAFFPSGDATSQLLATAGIFAVGFFMRPLGGWLFG